jgi:hypothetical protein
MLSLTIRSFGTRRVLASATTLAMLGAAMAVLGAATLALNTRTAAGAGGGGCFSTPGPVCMFTSHVASAAFGSVSADGCIFTEAFVTPFENLTSPGHIATTDVFVAAAKFNACTKSVLASASNVDPTTGNPVFDGMVEFGPNLDSAAVSGSAPMFDDFSGAQLFTSNINLVWEGFGPSSTFIDSMHIRAPGFLMNTHSMGTSREAEASGLVTDATGTNLASLPTLNASLENDTSGTVQLSHS